MKGEGHAEGKGAVLWSVAAFPFWFSLMCMMMQETFRFQSSDRDLISQPPSQFGVPLGHQTLHLLAQESTMSPAPEK